MIKLNKAAMFGLDARIALAIFGALSVISGAALYSAIQNAKVTSLLVDMKEVAKAHEQYYIDTVNYLSYSSGNESIVDIEKLVQDIKTGWQGPYLPYSITNASNLKHPLYDYIGFMYAKDGAWLNNNSIISWSAFDTTNKCDGGTISGNCYSWVMIYYVDDTIYNALDIMIDGSVTPNTGSIRRVTDANGTLVLMKTILKR